MNDIELEVTHTVPIRKITGFVFRTTPERVTLIEHTDI
jgi:hypothetical protein